MKTASECWECFAHTYTKYVSRVVQNEDVRREIICNFVDILGSDFLDQAPSDIGTKLNKAIMKYDMDPFRDEKVTAKENAMKIWRQFESVKLTLENVLKISLYGNIMDYAVMGWDQNAIEIDSILSSSIDLNHSRELEDEINRANTVMVLTDNAGEVVLDYFLLQYLKNKGKRILLSPKEGPMQNDATLEDIVDTPTMNVVDEIIPCAQAVGLDLQNSSPDFQRAFHESELFLFKGMGHYENAFELDVNGFYLLKAKCIPVARSLGVKRGDNVVVWNKKFRQ